MSKPILALDFDGVIHGYQSGWQGAAVCPDPITPGTVEWIKQAVDHFKVCIFSSRSGQEMGIEAMQFYLKVNFYKVMEPGDADPILVQLEWPIEKPPAMITIDDRALTFTGNWSDFPIDELLVFKPWNKRG